MDVGDRKSTSKQSCVPGMLQLRASLQARTERERESEKKKKIETSRPLREPSPRSSTKPPQFPCPTPPHALMLIICAR